MPETTHTPGPWMVGRESEEGRSYVAQASGPAYVARSVKTEDARLIAAAPDLLAAIETAIEHHETCSVGPDTWRMLRAAARAARRDD